MELLYRNYCTGLLYCIGLLHWNYIIILQLYEIIILKLLHRNYHTATTASELPYRNYHTGITVVDYYTGITTVQSPYKNN